MSALDIFGLMLLTYAFGIAFGYYLARIFFGV